MNTIELKISRKELQELMQADITKDDFLDTLLKKLIFGEKRTYPFTIMYYPARYEDAEMVSATLQVGNTPETNYCDSMTPEEREAQSKIEVTYTTSTTPDFGTKLESIKHIGDMVDGKMVCREDCPSVTHKHTPDTEEEVIDEPLHISAEALFKCQCKTKELLTSRDTYWKERVREAVEGMKVEVREHYDDCDVQTGKSQRGECRCGLWRNHHRSRNQALDTLLDNLK